MDKQHYQNLIDTELANLPEYVTEYYFAKNLSQTTQYQYLTEIRRFFTWLRDAGVSDAASNKDVSTTTLEHLKRNDVMLYVDFLKNRTNKQQTFDSNASINRSINALRSLFHYLTILADNNDGEPYFYRNVMAKIELLPDSKTLNRRAHEIEAKIYPGKIKHEFIDFLENKYEQQCNNYIKGKYKRNKVRDIAICALLLGTGIRVSECANANTEDINLKEATLNVVRKGGQQDTIPIASWTLSFIKNYLDQRQEIYKPDQKQKALFLTLYAGKAKRITTNAIEQFVKKYSTAFGRPLTPHKFRHTLASELYERTKDQVLVSQQLGQKGTSATDLYTHVNDNRQKHAVDETK